MNLTKFPINLRYLGLAVLALALVTFVGGPADATTVLQMNLDTMCDNADKIFRGTVLGAEESTLEVGGGELPVVTYTVRVDEAFKGDHQVVKGVPVVEITMVGGLKDRPTVSADGSVRNNLLAGMPRLVEGEEYLLFTTAPSSAGLSTTVGLGQGCFGIYTQDKQDMVLNENDNRGLLTTQPQGGPISYSELTSEIVQRIGG